jgi:PAS domain S-box-containing protein
MITRIEELSELSNINIAFWLYSKTHRTFQYISPRVKNIFETDIDKISDIRVFRKIVHPDDQVKVIRNLNGGYSGSVDELEYRIITSAGKIKWLKNTAISIKDSNEEIKNVIGCTYIKSKKKKREIPSDPYKNADKILKSFPDSFLVVNTKGKIFQGSIHKNEKHITVLNEKQVTGKTLTQLLNPKLSKKIKEKLGDEALNKTSLSFETEIQSRNIRTWFEIRMSKINEGTVLIVIRNITELIRKANDIEKFYSITEQSHELIMITDVTGTIEYINPMVTKVTGYTFNDLKGKNASIFNSGKHKDSFYIELWNSILNGQSYKGEFQNLKKDGEYYIEEKIITPLFNIHGQITNFISTGRDVTLERRKELRASKYKQLQETIDEKEQKTRTLSLIKSNEIERKKFAREIHEGLNQMLLAAMANLESLSAKNVISEDEKSKIEFINQMVSEIIQELRGISTNLSPISLYEFGLFPVLQQMATKINAGNTGIHIHFSSNIAGFRFKNEVEINIYRIIQEAIQNIQQHAHAKKIILTLNYNKTSLSLLIKDDGKGINMNNLEFKKMSTFGILNTEARAKSIGAALNIVSGKDKGFVIDLSLNTKKTNS